MIRLFVSDIDGCLSEPYQAMDLGSLNTLATFAQRGGTVRHDPVIPALSLCSGRPMPYVECLTQLLGISVPVLFESGGGIFDAASSRVMWSPHLTKEVESQVREVTNWFEKECVPGTSMIVDYAKRAHAGIIGPDPDEIIQAIPKVQAFVEASGLNFSVLPTYLSIDVVPPGITKEEGMQWLAELVNVDLSEIAYIGDSKGDLGALEIVGASFAPGNAKDVLKERVDHVTLPHAPGVLQALKMCIERNQQAVEIEELR